MSNWPPFNQKGPEIAAGDIDDFEKRFGVVLPQQYRAFLLEVNGGRTTRAHREFDHGVLNWLFSLGDSNPDADLVEWNEQVRSDIKSADLMIVGIDDGGGRILLAVSGEHSGEIWFQVHEGRPWEANPRVLWHDRRDFRKLADSFSGFLSSLRPLT